MDQSILAREDGIHALWRAGVTGTGVTVAVIDSGISEELSLYTDSMSDVTGEGPRDDVGHGTAMSRFILGYAPDARLASVKAFGADTKLNRRLIVNALDIVAGRPKVRLINLSVQLPSRFLWWRRCRAEKPCIACSRVRTLIARGAIPVVAVGNTGPGNDTVTCPARASNALTVGALDTRPDTQADVQPDSHSGTSVSAALFSGGIALLLSANPTLDLESIKEALRVTVTGVAGPVNAVGFGRPHFYRAYRYLEHRRLGRAFDPVTALDVYREARTAIEKRNWPEAHRLLARAASLAPSSSIFQAEMGRVLLFLGDVDGAGRHTQEAVNLDWSNSAAHATLARLFRLVGDEVTARVHEEAHRASQG